MVIVACLLIDTDWVRDMTNSDLVQRGLQLAAQVQLDGEERALEDGRFCRNELRVAEP